MGRFHSHLKEHAPAEALRLAQNELIDSGKFADPSTGLLSAHTVRNDEYLT